MRMSAPKKNGKPEDVITDRAGGLDLYNLAEITSWRHMIKRDGKIELDNMRSHIRHFIKEGVLQKEDLKINDPRLHRSDVHEAAAATGDPHAKVFPKIGLGPPIPKANALVTPTKFGETVQCTKGIKVVKGENVTNKHLIARMKMMEKTLKQVRRARVEAEGTLQSLQTELGLPVSQTAHISAPPSRSKLWLKTANGSLPSKEVSSNSKSTIRHGNSSFHDGKRVRSKKPSNLSIEAKEKSQIKTKETKVWNKITEMWEPKLRKVGIEGLLDTNESFRSQNISNLFIAPDHQGMVTSNQVGLMAIQDSIRRGFVDPNLYLKLENNRHENSCPRINSELTKFAETAIRNRLNPFALGRG